MPRKKIMVTERTVIDEGDLIVSLGALVDWAQRKVDEFGPDARLDCEWDSGSSQWVIRKERPENSTERRRRLDKAKNYKLRLALHEKQRQEQRELDAVIAALEKPTVEAQVARKGALRVQ